MKKFCTICFYGSIWGITEATIGYFTHLVHLHIASYLMIPISFWCMIMAYSRLKELSYVPLCVAAVAASIKLIDLVALPNMLPSYYVLSPASHILALGFLFSLYVFLFHKFKKHCMRFTTSATATKSAASTIATNIPCTTQSHCHKKVLKKCSFCATFASHKSFIFSALLGAIVIIPASIGMSFYRLWIISITTGVCIEPVSYDGIFTLKLIVNAVWIIACLVLSVHLYQNHSSIFSIKKDEYFEIYNAMPAVTAALGITLML